MNRAGKIGLLLSVLAICVMAVVVQRNFEFRRKPTAPVEIYEVIFRQFDAFQAADYSRAYQQVSTTFQERFDLDAFTELVRSDYPDLVRAHHLEFGPVAITPERALIQVYFVLPEGEVVPCIYSLIHEQRVWKIDAARVQKRWPPGQHLGGSRV